MGDERKERLDQISSVSPELYKVQDIAEKLEDYSPVLPDATVQAILSNSGLQTTDPQLTRVVSVAAQKFISDIAYDALQHCKMRGGGKEQKSKSSSKDKKYDLNIEDLVESLSDQGICVRKPQYYN